MRFIQLATGLTLIVALSACAPKLPRIHKITIQQGNVITQDMVNRLKPGMSRSQVAFVMGEPVLKNTFNDDRWDYIYTIDIPGVFDQQRRVSLFFESDVLAYFTGDMAPESAKQEAETETAGVIKTELPSN